MRVPKIHNRERILVKRFKIQRYLNIIEVQDWYLRFAYSNLLQLAPDNKKLEDKIWSTNDPAGYIIIAKQIEEIHLGVSYDHFS